MKSKVRIAYVDPMSYSNLAQYDYQLLSNIDGFEINFLCSTKFDLEGLGVKLKEIYSYNDLKGLSKIWSYLKSQMLLSYMVLFSRINLVHFQWLKVPYFDILILILFKLFGVKMVFTAHNILPHDSGSKYSFAFRIIYRLVHGIIVHSKKTKDELIQLFKIREDKVHVIPHGILDMTSGVEEEDIEHLQTGFIDKYNLSGKVIFSFLGNMGFYKGIDLVVDAWSISELKNNKDAVLIIAGKGSSDLFDKISTLENVIIMNRFLSVEEFMAVMRLSDYLLLPYRLISQSGVLLTAIKERKKVIVSNVGGLTDPFEFGDIGYVLSDLNATTLGDTILNALDTNFKAIRDDVWSNIANHYDWKSIGKKTEVLYRTLLEGKYDIN